MDRSKDSSARPRGLCRSGGHGRALVAGRRIAATSMLVAEARAPAHGWLGSYAFHPPYRGLCIVVEVSPPLDLSSIRYSGRKKTQSQIVFDVRMLRLRSARAWS